MHPISHTCSWGPSKRTALTRLLTQTMSDPSPRSPSQTHNSDHSLLDPCTSSPRHSLPIIPCVSLVSAVILNLTLSQHPSGPQLTHGRAEHPREVTEAPREAGGTMEPWVLTLVLTQNINPLSPSLGLSSFHYFPNFRHLHIDVVIYATSASIFITQYFRSVPLFFLIMFVKPGFDVLRICSILIKIMTQIKLCSLILYYSALIVPEPQTPLTHSQLPNFHL